MKFQINLAILALLAILPALYECKDSDKKIRKERRRGNLGGASRDASKADCAKIMDIKLYKDSPGMLRFKPNIDACKAGPTYVGSTEDGKCHVTLVSSDAATSSNTTNATTTAFAASVTCEDSGAVYSIGTDGNGTMTVVERMQADYGEELDPFDVLPTEERVLLEARIAATNSATTTEVSKRGLRGKVVNQLRSIDDRFLTDNHHSDSVHRDIQGNIVIDALVLYTADAECANAGKAFGCVRNSRTAASIRSKINLAITETNTAYSLSGVKVALNLVLAAYDDYVETDDMITTINALWAKPSVLALREAYGADVVAMIVGRGQHCGVSYYGPIKENMYSVSHYTCATGYYTFGHEIGHNLGLNHDRGAENMCTDSVNNNYGYRDPEAEFRSILAYGCAADQCTGNSLPEEAACTRVQRFSNTYALYNGKPIGDVNNDNASWINNVAVEVSNYFNRTTVTANMAKITTQPTTKPTTSKPTTRRPITRAPTTTKKPTSKPPTKRPTSRRPVL